MGLSNFDRMGVCLFDKPDLYGANPDAVSGVACLSGGDPFPVKCIGNLPSSAYWLTNISESIFYRTGLAANPRIFGSGYLRTKVQSIIRELGLTGASLESQAVVLSDIFDRTMAMAAVLFGVDLPPRNSLAAGLAELHGIDHYKQLPEIQPSMVEACQSFTHCERVDKRDYVWATLTLHRYEHAKKLLSLELPNSDFYFVDPGHMPAPSQRLDWLLNLPCPAMAEIEVIARDRDVSRIINYGAGAGDVRRASAQGHNYHTGNKRCVATADEVAILSQYCDIYITRALITDARPSRAMEIPEQGRVLQVSYSYGLLMENLWVSLTRQQRAGTIQRSPVTAWIQSADRMACFDVALDLMSSGVEVISYGYGRVTVGIPTEDLEKLSSIAYDLSLIPPVNLNGEFHATDTQYTVEKALAILHGNGQLEKVLNLDHKAFEWLLSKYDASRGTE